MSAGPRELNLETLVHLVLRQRRLLALVLVLVPLFACLARRMPDAITPP